MKTPIFPQRVRMRFGAKLLVCSLFLVLAGCVTQRIVWSPDGKQAAVLTNEGLYLCDADGKISGLLLPDVATVAWFKDSRRLAIARSQSCTNWHCLAAALNPQSQENVRRAATELLAKLQKGNRDQVLEAERRSEEKKFFARLLYLRDEGGDAALKLLEGAKALKDLKVEVSTLAVAQVSTGVLDVGPILAAEIGGIVDIRISPNGAAVAYTANTNSTDDIKLGVLTRRRVLNERGQVEIQNAKDDLAGLLFNDQARVRCLRDGRILFASEEWRLPVTTNDLPQRQQLFALDPERQSTLTPLVPRSTQEMLPAGLSYFEISPDEKRIAVGGDKSRVAVFTLASGNVELLQDATDTDLKSIPCWRSASELCYIAIQSSNTNQPKAEVALWENGKTRIISQTWPKPARKGLLE